MCRQLYLEAYCLAVGELPQIEGRFPGVIFDSFQDNISGIVKPLQAFTKSLHCTDNKTDWGYELSFGNNQYHDNVSPCISVYIWRRIN